MRACIITIGDELLQGFTLDTNAYWLSGQLLSAGVNVEKRLTIADRKEDILHTMSQIQEDGFDYVFITGGLGPTHDDITRNTMADFFGVGTRIMNDHLKRIETWFRNRRKPVPEALYTQATVLNGSEPIPNSVGSALGMTLINGDTRYFILPGVPAEMKRMMTDIILPKYCGSSPESKYVTLNTTGVGESIVSEQIQDLIRRYEPQIKVAFLPQHTGVNIRLRNMGGSPELLQEFVRVLKSRLGNIIYSEDGRELHQVVGQLLLKSGLTVAVAESCTGGLIAKKLTDNPGSSGYFLGGVVAYHNDLKINFLNVPKETLDTAGAVSEETARAMAEGIRERIGAHICISTTGISGPGGGTREKPVGLVYIGMAAENSVTVRQFNFLKERELHRETTSCTALNMIRLYLLDKGFSR